MIGSMLATMAAVTALPPAGTRAGEGPRIEVSASRWTWPARLAFVNDAMRCTFAGTNENTQLLAVDLRGADGGWRPATGRAGPLIERHPAAVDTFTRLPEGFLMERRLPDAVIATARGAMFRAGARLRLAGNTARLDMQEEIQWLRAGRGSAECFSIDLGPARPHALSWLQGEGVITTNLAADGVLRLPADAVAVHGSNGVAVLRLAVRGAAHATVQREALIRQSRHDTRCSFVVSMEPVPPGGTTQVQLDLWLLPVGTPPDDLMQPPPENEL
jgi:hypothetical protein